MAIHYPAKAPDGLPDSERAVFEALTALDADWRVFHSVVWQGLRSGRPGDGEADFVLLHPKHGVLILEVKGGRVEVEGGEWYSRDRHNTRHRIKNPFTQAAASKHSLFRHLIEHVDDLKPSCFGHAVILPDTHVDAHIGVYGPRALIVDRADLRTLPKVITTICQHWQLSANLSRQQISTITSDLAPTLVLRTGLTHIVKESEHGIVELTNQQLAIFRQLRRMRRVSVLGGAGTGKTVLAVERALQLAREHETLFLCFNEPLAAHIKRLTAKTPRLTVSTFHALCAKIARSAETSALDFDDRWWDETAPNILHAAASDGQLSYGALVVDEAQDFADSWLTALLLLLDSPDDSPCYLFGDVHQQLYRRDTSVPDAFPQFTLDVNCRNTMQIADRVAAVIGDAGPTSGVAGAPPKFIHASDTNEFLEAIQDLAATLLSVEGIDCEDLVVLTNDARTREQLRTRLAGDFAFVAPGQYGVLVETVHRFKGLESPVVIVALSDDLLTSPETGAAVAYVGISRARSALFVVGSRAVRRFMRWPAQ